MSLPIHAPDVVLTDYLITLLCLYFGFMLWYRPAMHHDLRRIFVGLFFFSALAAALGGTYHGFFEVTPHRLWSPLLWRGTLVSIGCVAFYMWHGGCHLSVPQSWRRWISMLLQGALLIFAYLVAYERHDFIMAIAAYLPAVVYFTGVVTYRLFKDKDSRMLFGLLAMLLTIGAAIIQVRKIGLHPEYFNHNALYHLIQAAGFYVLYRFASRVVVWS